MQKPLSEEEVDELISDLLGVESKVFNLFLLLDGGGLGRPVLASWF